jgi:sugar lactone lactonase YvrE
MITFRRLVGTIAVTTALTAALTGLPATAHSAPPDRIKLPRGWQPEGITTDGRSLYAGSLANGAILRADPRTGKTRLLATGKDGRKAVGVEYDRRRDVLWVAGGETGVVRAHDADTGKVLRTFTLPPATARFVNDLVVTRRAVYATDSEQAELAVVKLRKRHPHRVPPKSALRMLPLTGDLVLEDGFDLNGIAKFHGRLVAVQSNVGKLFRINGRSGMTREIDLGGATLTNGDGIEPGTRVLYVVQNQLNQVAVLQLDRRVTRGAVRRTISDPGFDVPTTAALVRRSLYLVNARFGTDPTPDTRYWITRVAAR